MNISATEKETVSGVLQTIIGCAGFQLSFTVSGDVVSEGSDGSAEDGAAVPSVAKNRIYVEFSGADTPLLTARNGELLHALEHIAAKALQLEPEDHDRISFDADSYKANRDRAVSRAAEEAIEVVRRTGRPYSFPPMTSRERRLLHLALSGSGLPTASSGEVPRRFVVLYPEGHDVNTTPTAPAPVPVPDRAHAIRNSFRRR